MNGVMKHMDCRNFAAVMWRKVSATARRKSFWLTVITASTGPPFQSASSANILLRVKNTWAFATQSPASRSRTRI